MNMPERQYADGSQNPCTDSTSGLIARATALEQETMATYAEVRDIPYFKKILVEGISVRGAEDVARQVKAEVQKREPGRKKDKIYIPEQDTMSRTLSEKYGWNVKFDQSRVLGKIIIAIKGNEEKTTEELKRIYEKLLEAGIT